MYDPCDETHYDSDGLSNLRHNQYYYYCPSTSLDTTS